MTQNELKRELTYNPNTGDFTRNFASNKLIGGINSKGYVRVLYKGKYFQAPRLAFLYMTGKIPKEVDHRDRIRHNNKWDNLRAVTHSLNMHNMSLAANNTTGYKGISYHKASKKYRAYITVSSKTYDLGLHLTLDEAIAARKTGEKKHHGT